MQLGSERAVAANRDRCPPLSTRGLTQGGFGWTHGEAYEQHDVQELNRYGFVGTLSLQPLSLMPAFLENFV